MVQNKIKTVLFAIFLSLFTFSLLSANDLSSKYLTKADEALEAENIADAYKYINASLATEKDKLDHSKIIYLAQTIYILKLQAQLENFDDIEMVDIEQNLEKYPDIANTKIKKLLKQIELDQAAKKEALRQKERADDIRFQQEIQEAQQRNMEIQLESNENFQKSMEETTQALREQNEAAKQNQLEMKQALESGLKDMGNAFSESAKETKRSTRVIAFAVIGIALLIVLIIVIVTIFVHKGLKQQEIQQETYFKMVTALAASQQNQTNLLLGGITDLYSSNPTLRLAGSSTWQSPEALPDVTFSEEDEKALKELAVKCEELGSKIDQTTGRKNNSKNVSELVYKMSIKLGIPQGMSMLNFCAAMVYDAGLLALDSDLLTRETLSDDEKEAMKEHVNLFEKYLDFVPKKYWSVFEDAAIKHHENMDGTGYPKGLKGEEIPQIARLIRVAETYISLSSKRNYRQTMDKESAIQALREQPQFYDSQVVDVLDSIV